MIFLSGPTGVKVSIKEAAMKKLYGQTTAVQVLDGAVPQLPVMEPLVAELQMMQQGGSTPTHVTAKHY